MQNFNSDGLVQALLGKYYGQWGMQPPTNDSAGNMIPQWWKAQQEFQGDFTGNVGDPPPTPPPVTNPSGRDLGKEWRQFVGNNPHIPGSGSGWLRKQTDPLVQAKLLGWPEAEWPK